VKTAAEDSSVTRIFVNAAIKKEMCTEAGTDRHWLAKVRPWWGHSEHFHIRLACPDYRECKGQPSVPTGDGCGHALDSAPSTAESAAQAKAAAHLGQNAGRLPSGCDDAVTLK
jgi:murein endopeptidase